MCISSFASSMIPRFCSFFYPLWKLSQELKVQVSMQTGDHMTSQRSCSTLHGTPLPIHLPVQPQTVSTCILLMTDSKMTAQRSDTGTAGCAGFLNQECCWISSQEGRHFILVPPVSCPRQASHLFNSFCREDAIRFFFFSYFSFYILGESGLRGPNM